MVTVTQLWVEKIKDVSRDEQWLTIENETFSLVSRLGTFLTTAAADGDSGFISVFNLLLIN